MNNEDKYKRVEIYAFKAKNGKSWTIPITREQFDVENTNGKLILNVSIAGFIKFLQEENWKKFGLNKIVEA